MPSAVFVFVEEGDRNAGRGFLLATPNPITLGTTALDFEPFTSDIGANASESISLSNGSNDDVPLSNIKVPFDLVTLTGLTVSGELTGLVAPDFAQLIALISINATLPLTIKHESSSSSIHNRFLCPGATDIVLDQQNRCVVAAYDKTLLRWRVIAKNFDIATGGGGGGGSVSYGAFGSLPTGSDGDTYYSTDAPVVSIKQSGAWQHFYKGTRIVPINFGAFTASENADTIHVADAVSVYVSPSRANAPMNYYKKAAPSTPYHVACKFIIRSMVPIDYNNVGMFLRESSSGKFHILAVGFYSGVGHYFLRNSYAANSSTISSDYKNDALIGRKIVGCDGTRGAGGSGATDTIHEALVCLRMSDDGSYRTCDYSLDGGETWTAFNPVSVPGHTTDLTPNEVGFFAGTFAGSDPMQVRFISWEES